MARFSQALTETRLFPLVALLLGCVFFASTIHAANIQSDLREIHLLNRLAFGPGPGDIEHVKSIGTDQYIKEQLAPRSISLPDSLAGKLNSLSTLHLSPPEL